MSEQQLSHPLPVASIISQAWDAVLREIFLQATVPNESTLQARLSEHIRNAERHLLVVCEPALRLDGSRFDPDLVIVRDNEVVAYAELKMSLLGCVGYQHDLLKLRALSNYRGSVDVLVDPKTGKYIDPPLRNALHCLAVFGVVTACKADKGDCEANDEISRKQQMVDLGDRWLHLTANAYRHTGRPELPLETK